MARRLALVATLLVAATVAAGFAVAGGNDDKALQGSTLERATAAALRHTGGGTVVETEAGDDAAAYGVEVRLSDGRQVEVNLDERFVVIGQEPDDDSGEEEEDDD